MARYPLSVKDERCYSDGYHGKVFICDIDKTYLATAFSSLSGLAKIPFEFAIDKKAIAGMPAILRGLRRGTDGQVACHPLYFISASPSQIRKVIERKMLLDGVEWDGLIFKDWNKVFRTLTLKRLNEQVGFKLCALLKARLNRPDSVEILFGDSMERDTEAYTLYSKLVNGDISPGGLEQEMKELRVSRRDRACVQSLVTQLSKHKGAVEAIYIHVVSKELPKRFEKYRDDVFFFYTSAELAQELAKKKYVDQLTISQIEGKH